MWHSRVLSLVPFPTKGLTDAELGGRGLLVQKCSNPACLPRLIFGTLYPAYSSYKAVKTKNVKEYVSV